MHIEKVLVGTIKNEKVFSYNLRNENGFGVNVLNYGGIITDVLVPDRDGKIENVITRYKDIETYEKNPSYYGALIGRTSGRIANAEASFNGEKLNFSLNYGINQGHGGFDGFHSKFYEVKMNEEDDFVSIELSRLSEDNEEGYPGNLEVRVIYSVDKENNFTINYKAKSDKDTLVNLTNHSYFNLSGDCKEDILNHELYIDSDFLVELNNNQVPTGQLIEVTGTAFDFNLPKTIGRDINDHHPQLEIGQGYDHGWILNGGDQVKLKLIHKNSGRCLDLYTNNNSTILYTMNFIDEEVMGNGRLPRRRDAIAIEAQSPPIGVDSCFIKYSYLKAGEEYNKVTRYKFTTI